MTQLPTSPTPAETLSDPNSASSGVDRPNPDEPEHSHPGELSLAAQCGEEFANGCQLLQSRYAVSEDEAVLIAATAVATAIGPGARIRNPRGTDLPLSLEVVFCAGRQSGVLAAICGIYRFFREIVSRKIQWNCEAGERRLRAEHAEALATLSKIEAKLADDDPKPKTLLPINLAMDPAEQARFWKEERKELLKRRDDLLQEVSERRMDLAPRILADDPTWELLLALNQVTFDGCITAISGSPVLRELLGLGSQKLGSVARLFRASRHGHDLSVGTAVVQAPVLIAITVVDPVLLSSLLNTPSIWDSQILHGLMIESAPAPLHLNVNAFVEDSGDTQWREFLARLFQIRSRSLAQLYHLDVGGFEIFENFRGWALELGDEHPDLQDAAALWPETMLKLGLCLHIAQSEEKTVSATALKYAASVIRSVGTKQIELLQRLRKHLPESHQDDVDRVVMKLKRLGGQCSVRDLVRTFSGQNYAKLTPVLDRAVAEGAIVQDGKTLSLPLQEKDPSTSTRQ